MSTPSAVRADFGEGSVNPEEGVTDCEGEVATAWALGETAGDERLELPGMPRPAPMRVRLVHQFGNGAPDVEVTFTVGSDDLLEESEAVTDVEGIAEASWTLGAGLGSYQAQATAFMVPDSTVQEPKPLPGSPVDFTASAVAFSVGPVDSNLGLVADTMTVLGMGFDPDPTANAVTVGGEEAEVVDGTRTSLSVIVPSFGCTPAARSLGVPAFTRVVDQLPASRCPASDEAFIIYVATPAEMTAVQFGDLLLDRAPDLAHHLTHVIQHARRLLIGGGAPPSWLGEGQAQTAIEIVGMAIRGDEFPGGQPALEQALIDADPSTDFLETIRELTGSPVAEIAVDWAMTLLVDGRIPAGAGPAVRFASWDLADIHGKLPVEQRLTAPAFGF
jgi:hypothetical protein